MVRILHTADVHLGRAFPSFREKGPDYRRQLLATFDQITSLAAQQNVSLLLIAGDLFDSNAILGTTVRTVLASFRKLETAGIRVCILPGIHDAHTEDSVYRFTDFPANVTVLTSQRVSHTYADLDLTVYGKAFEARLAGTSALQGLSLSANSRLHVGMAHCSLKMNGATDEEAMLVDRTEIGASRLDYLALGHRHSFRDCSHGATSAFYCGSPEPISMDQKEAGSVALVTIHDRGRVDVQQIRVGTMIFDEMTIDAELMKSLDDIVQIISARANPNLVLQVTLCGVPDLERELDPRELEDELGGQFFCLRVVDHMSDGLGGIATEDFPQDTVAGGFIRAMEAKMSRCSPDEKGIYAEALRLGIALIQKGPQVIK